MKSFSPHSSFFSSLKQVEKRLKLDDPSSPSQPQLSNLPSSVESSLSAPIYLNFDQSIKPTSTHQDSSDEPPLPFLSSSPQKFTQTQLGPLSLINSLDYETPVVELNHDAFEVDDIEQLMQLLGLSDCGEDENEMGHLCLKGGVRDESCNCENGFYKKIVGVKGPKCAKEVARLNGWVKHFANDGGEERIEPLRLAHLLLGKASLASDDCGVFEGIEFPSTIEDFLEYDPPSG